MKKLSQAASNGVAVGAWLTERAPRALFDEYMRRPGNSGTTPAARRVDETFAALRKALGPKADDEAVAAALHALDGAIWDVAAEHEETAFFAAYSMALNLKGGR